MKKGLAFVVFAFASSVAFGQSNCDYANNEAYNDFQNDIYCLHSTPFYPEDNTYLYVLREDYNVQLRFFGSDSMSYYDCYDSTLTTLLKQKFGQDFLRKASVKADGLESTENWRSEPEFPGGEIAMFKFIDHRLKIDVEHLRQSAQRLIIIQFTIKENGELENINVIRGINVEIDNEVVQIFEDMPKWKPAYLYGIAVKKRYTLSLDITSGK